MPGGENANVSAAPVLLLRGVAPSGVGAAKLYSKSVVSMAATLAVSPAAAEALMTDATTGATATGAAATEAAATDAVAAVNENADDTAGFEAEATVAVPNEKDDAPAVVLTAELPLGPNTNPPDPMLPLEDDAAFIVEPDDDAPEVPDDPGRSTSHARHFGSFSSFDARHDVHFHLPCCCRFSIDANSAPPSSSASFSSFGVADDVLAPNEAAAGADNEVPAPPPFFEAATGGGGENSAGAA